ncbi:MAG: hypothetical protein KGL18_04655 [Burkholderiales bacterium]|nr:hypothetical protein [Burkholderiales bacterium]MDE1926781.1 hypothetical protein [Burkholderiales bacterium]MDE2158278.1 hypothetical protein [Burkholderiales bacterium]MDE2502256.1 hypothetical protein [Burkholderiales bacterium]
MPRIAPAALVIAGLLVALTGARYAQAAPVHAGWAHAHPLRAEVNHRLALQNRRIHHEVAEGSLSRAQAAHLHRADRQIRQEERAMASQDGGRITKAEQNVLNAQENRVSHRIGQ